MEMQSHKLYMSHGSSQRNDMLHILHCYAKLVLGQTRGDMGMRVSAYIGIDAEADTSHTIQPSGNLVDDLQFGNALHIKILDACLQAQLNLPIALSHTCKHNLAGRKTCIQTSLDLTSAHAVRTEASDHDMTQHLGIGTCLDGIVKMIAFVKIGLGLYGLECLVKQYGVVIVKGCAHRLELRYREQTF